MVRILVIENDRIVSRDLVGILGSLGHEVVGVATCFADGVALANEHSPDLALIDIQIDGPRDGIALASEIREELPIALAFLTSHADHRTVMKASVTRPNGYLIKPFNTASVDALIQTALANFSVEGSRVDTARIVEQELSERSTLSNEQRAKVTSFIERKLGNNIKTEDLAVLCTLSSSEFSRRFQASFGVPPYHYLIEERLKEAKRLLRNTSWPIAEIAIAVGFSSQSHLTSSFHKAFDVTPLKYRRFAS